MPEVSGTLSKFYQLSSINWLHLHAASSNVLLDFLVANPNLAMALDVGKFHVNLVEDNLFTAFLVDDGVDGTRKHEVCTDFHTSVLGGFFGGVALLVGKFVAEVFAFIGVGYEFSLARIDEGAFDVLDERFDADVFMALVANLSNHDCRDGTLLCCELAVPWTAKAVVNHFVGNEAGVRIIPAARKVSYGIGVETGDFFTAIACATGKESEAYAKGEKPNFGHFFLLDWKCYVINIQKKHKKNSPNGEFFEKSVFSSRN